MAFRRRRRGFRSKRRPRRFARRRRFRRRRRRNVTAMSTEPRTQFRALVYVGEDIDLDPGAVGVTASHYFRCNSLFDPDFTGTGHQPHGFDSLALKYGGYRVRTATITCTFMASSTANANKRVGIQLTSQSSPVSTVITDIVESPHVVYKVLATSDSGRSVVRVRMTVRPWHFLGVAYKNSNYSANVVSSPTNVCFFRVFCGPVDEVQDTTGAQVDVHITYKAQFFDGLEIGPS